MLKILIRHWRFLAVRAVLAAAFALLTLALRELVKDRYLGAIFLAGVQTWFAVFAITAGAATLIAALAGVREAKSWLLLLDGAAGVAAGAFILSVPALTFAHLVQIVGLWGAVIGALECTAGIRLRQHLEDEWLLLTSGIGTLAFAIVLFARGPSDDAGLLIWLGWFAAFSALVMALLAARLRAISRQVQKEAADARGAGD
jgi:uncharacterized membrane protein HdeD (DUF308 family)